ncbi:MAG TPA: 3-methylitaconate isomerase [Sulfurospirillum sp. UBA11407]|nr:MAG TPA: 3-methylitaconate isomerase [Sulfurospirillum sp. UBA11407]
MRAFPCVIMRGGTSKAAFFKKDDIPKEEQEIEKFLLDVMGSPDARQIDGLGGGNSLTSKVAIIGLSDREDVDVDYTFCQVSITDKLVDMKGNCGNISSAVGPYAVNEKMVHVKDGMACVRIYNTNTKKIILSHFLVKDGMAVEEGELEISGVPNRAASIEVTFSNPEGAVTGKLLPTTQATQMVETSFGKLPVSIIDAGNPLIFMKASDLGLRGNELPNELDDLVLSRIEEVRSIGAELCGFCSKEQATKESPAVPKATLIDVPSTYSDIKGRIWESSQYDISLRMMSMQKPHQALAVTGAVCVTFASKIEGSLVHAITQEVTGDLRIGHPGGVMQTKYYEDEGKKGVTVLRTARPIMKGVVYTKNNYTI